MKDIHVEVKGVSHHITDTEIQKIIQEKKQGKIRCHRLSFNNPQLPFENANSQRKSFCGVLNYFTEKKQ